MSIFEQQTLLNQKAYAELIRDYEVGQLDILNSYLPIDKLHEIINNPLDEVVDES